MSFDVLLVHDDSGLLQDWSLALLGTGHNVVAVRSPMSALKMIEAGQAADALITPIAFGPGQPNGVSLASMVRRKRPGIKVVLVGLPENEPHAQSIGLLLQSPVEPIDVVVAVQTVLTESPTGQALR